MLVLGARDVGRDAGRAVARMTRAPALSAAREREDAQGARVAVDERGGRGRAAHVPIHRRTACIFPWGGGDQCF